jgi:hypothetical protein
VEFEVPCGCRHNGAAVVFMATMHESHPALHAILRLVDADDATQLLAMEVIAQPRERRDALIRRLRELYCAGIAGSGHPSRIAGRLGEVLESRLRHWVAEIEARGGGIVGTA